MNTSQAVADLNSPPTEQPDKGNGRGTVVNDDPFTQDAQCTLSLLAAIAEAIPDAVYVKDRVGHYLFCNSAARCYVEQFDSPPLGNDAFAFFDATSVRAIVEHDQQVMEKGTPETREVQLHFGEVKRTFLITKSPYRDERGEIIGVIGIARDITDRKSSEETLRESERRLAEGERLAHFGYWERDLLTDRNNWSDETYRIYGLDPQERNITAAESWSMIHPGDHPMVREAVDRALQFGAPMDIEYRAIRPDGEIRFVHSRGGARTDDTGQTRLMFGVLQDVTEYRAAKEALRSSECDLATAQRVAQIGNWRLNVSDGTIVWSDELYRLMGVDKKSFSATLESALECVHPDDRDKVAQVIERARADNQYFEVEYRIPRAGEADRTVRAIGYAVENDAGEVIQLFGTAQDITDRKRVDVERERLHQEVLTSREKLEEMSNRVMEAHESERRNLAHELHDEIGQVLTAVNLNLLALRADVNRIAASRLDDSMQIVSQAIHQVRELSLNLWPASIDLLGLEAALSAYLDRESARAGIVTEFCSSLKGRRLPPRLEAICFRVVQSAMTNVLRHAQASQCWVDVELSEDAVAIFIRDDGIGFDPAIALEQGMQGKGFGLLGMQERVQLLAGRFEIQSCEGRGTTISATFPLGVSTHGKS